MSEQSTAEVEQPVPTRLANMSEGISGSRRIDRATRFGSPFRLEKDGGDYSREGSVEAYIGWFRDRLRNGHPSGPSAVEFRQALEDLRGRVLGCWCVPKLCHGHVILYYLDQGEPPESVDDLREWGAPDRTNEWGDR